MRQSSTVRSLLWTNWVALPSTLQNHASTHAEIVYYVFDVLVLSGVDVMREPLFAVPHVPSKPFVEAAVFGKVDKKPPLK